MSADLAPEFSSASAATPAAPPVTDKHASATASITARELVQHPAPILEPPIPADLERPHGHVIVCGLGGIGMRIVEQLHRAGEPVTVLEEYADHTQLDVVHRVGRVDGRVLRHFGRHPDRRRHPSAPAQSSASSTTS